MENILSYDSSQSSSFSSYDDFEQLSSLETCNNNRVYELDKRLGDVEESDDMEGFDDMESEIHEDLYDYDYDHDDDDLEQEDDQLELKQGMTFDTWKIAEAYLETFAKQKGFCFRKRRCETDPIDNTVVRKRTFECSHARVNKSVRAILEEDRRDRSSEMIGCPWHINMAFPKTAKGVRINSIIGEHNHSLNPLVMEISPKFRRLTNEMLEKIKFWTIQGKMGIPTQYNLLVASFPDKIINSEKRFKQRYTRV